MLYIPTPPCGIPLGSRHGGSVGQEVSSLYDPMVAKMAKEEDSSVVQDLVLERVIEIPYKPPQTSPKK